MSILILKHKEEYNFIIHSIIKDGLKIEDVIVALKNQGIERTNLEISKVIRQHLKGKMPFIEEEFNTIKYLYEQCNCGVNAILTELTNKGYKRDKLIITKIIEECKFKKGVIFSDEEKDLIHKLYCIEKKSIKKILNEVLAINKFRNRNQLEDYIKNSNLIKASIWGEDELKILKKYYPVGGSKECKRNGLNRSSRDIIAKANKLSLYYNNRCAKLWSVEEDEYLKENYKELTKDELATNLNRSIYSITNRVNRLGLSLKCGWTEDELEILEECYTVGGVTLCNEKGLLKSRATIIYKANSLGLNKEIQNRWTKAELKLLKEYYPIGGSKLCKIMGLERSNTVISNKACRLGIRSGIDRKEPVKWLKEDIELLKKYYPLGGVKLCKEKGLNRTNNSIIYKAYLLGINAPGNSWSEKDIELLKKYYPIGGVKLCWEKGVKRGRASIYSKARYLGLTVDSDKTL